MLNDTVDLGIGYAEFSVSGEGKAAYTISSAEGESNQFNHAGYVIHDGAEVHLQLTGAAGYMYEWRKIGAGDLYIEGSGNNNVLLNIGGSGTTYLNRADGYAAYNVLVNNGATVVIKDADQIARDLTFGNRGGKLDLNGVSMEWRTSAETEGAPLDGFSINALTESAVIANELAGSSSTITYTEAGHTGYVGSFADTANSSLKVVYDAGADSTWTLNSIHTNLQHADSGLQVKTGRVILSGTNTVHGEGSDVSAANKRYVHENDWHYADATMGVTVGEGAVFELGSHARLIGDVTVNEGGTYVMRESVRHRMEYVEGGQKLEDTSLYSAYFGHKGDVVLNGGTFAVQFNEGVDANTTYAYNVTGTGAMTVDTGLDGGSLTFGGSVDAGVSKTLNRGSLILTGAAAADTTNKWTVNTAGVIVQQGTVADTLAAVSESSTGALGLAGDCTTQVNLGNHTGMSIGAQAGTTVQYGAVDTLETLNTATPLGGGGKLLVNYALSGTDTLNVDGKGWSSGVVQLNNVASDYAGTVNVQSEGGLMTLTTGTEGALAGATVNLNSGGVYRLTDEQISLAGTVNVNAGGMIQGKDVVLTGTVNLNGSLDYHSFTVQNGATLNLQSGGRLDATYAATIAEGGTMRLNQNTLSDKVNLENGGIMYGNGGTIGSGATVLATEGTGKLNAGTGTFNVNGTIGAAVGATLSLENGTFKINHGNLNADGGTLALACSSVELAYRVNWGTQNIGGTLAIAEDVTINATQGDPNSYRNITHQINHLHINSGKTLTLVEGSNELSHVYNITSLTGQGTIIWQADNRWFNQLAYAGTSRLMLNGDNSFTGSLTVVDKDSHGSFQQVGLTHDYAARNMVINLWGDSGLAINTENAHIAGVGGEAGAFVYAGVVKTASSTAAPTSTVQNTLTIDTSGATHTYNGTLLGDEINGLNIVKEGQGTQTFTNSANVVHDVVAMQGSLVFTNAPTVHGEVGIAQGAQLQIGTGAFSLDSGKTLRVLMGEAGTSAKLNNSLVINGGTIDFEAYNEGKASLELGENCALSIGSTAEVTLAFSHCGNIKEKNSFPEQESYLLLAGDVSGLSFSTESCRYLDVDLTANTEGLYASFSLKDGYEYWMGNVENWTPTKTNVVITGMSPFSEVMEVENYTYVNTGILDNTGSVTVTSSDGSLLQFGTLEKHESGELIVNDNAMVMTDTLQIHDACRISGSGSLTATNLELNADLTTGMALRVGNISNTGNHTWTLDGSQGAFTQSLTVNQLNSLGGITVEGLAELAVSTGGDETLSVNLNGSGTVSKGGAGKLTTTGSLNVSGFNVDAGSFEAQGSVNIGRLNVAGGLTAQIYNAAADSGASKSIDVLQFGDGAVFETNDRAVVTAATTIGNVTLASGSATVQDVYNSGYYKLESLSLADGVESATLKLRKNAESNVCTVFVLGSAEKEAGNFAGTIQLSQQCVEAGHTNPAGDTNRDAAIVLNHADIAAKAKIEFADAVSSTAVLGLGINVDNATIGGISSAQNDGTRAKVFNGTIAAGNRWSCQGAEDPGAGAEVFRSLTIDSAAGTDATFYGEVMSHLNLVKTGSGSQVFSGTSGSFNGSIDVQEGTLGVHYGMFHAASGLKVAEGAVLSLNGFAKDNATPYALTVGEGTEFDGVLALNFTVDGNGSSFDFSNTVNEIRVDSGRVKLDSSTFGSMGGPTLVMTSIDSQLVFDGSGTVVNCHVELNDTITIHANLNKDGELTGEIRGHGGLIKAGAGTLKLSGFNSYEGLTTVNDGTLVVNTLDDLGMKSMVNTPDGSTESGQTDQPHGGMPGDVRVMIATSLGKLHLESALSATDGVVTVNNVGGTGTLSLELNDAAAQTLAVDSRFTGTTHVRSGQFSAAGSSFGNGLQLGDGVHLRLADAASFAKNLVLDGTSELHRSTDAALTITGNMTANGNAGALVRCDSGVLNLNGTVNLNSFTQDADDTTNIGRSATIGSLIGSGAFNVQSGATALLSNVAQFDGAYTVDGGTANFRTTNSAAKDLSLGDVVLRNGATLGTRSGSIGAPYAVNIDSLQVEGTAYLKTNDVANDAGWQASFNIAALSSAAGSDATLRLETNSKTTNKTVFNLNGAGDSLFRGNIILDVSNDGDRRRAALNINDSTVTRNAVITLDAPAASSGSVMLGVGVDGATVRGINDGGGTANRYIVSGALATDEPIASGSDVHSLHIATQSNSDSYTSSATVLGNLNLVKSGNGTQAFTGDMSAFNGTIVVHGGALSIGTADTTTSLGLGGTIVNNGTLNLNSDVKVSSAGVLDVLSIEGVTKGFATGTENITCAVVNGTGPVNLKTEARVYIGDSDTEGTLLTKSGNTVSFSTTGGAATDTYYVFEAGAVTRGIAPAEGQSLNHIYLGSEGELTYDTASFANTVTMKGWGTYVLGSTTTANVSGLTDAATWKGTVELSNVYEGSTAKSSLNLSALVNRLGNAGSTVQLSGANGYFNTPTIANGVETATNNVVVNLQLVNGAGTTPAILLTNGNGDPTPGERKAVIAGKVSGSGDIKYQAWADSGDSTTSYEFTGNVSGWNGNFIVGESVNGGGNANVIFSGDATTINASFRNEDTSTSTKNDLYLVIGSAEETARTYTVNGTVAVDKLTVNQSTTFDKAVTVADTLNMATGTELSLKNGAMTVGGCLSGAGSKLSTKGKTLNLNGSGDNVLGILDAGSSTVNLGAGVNLQVETNMWINTMNLAENATFSKDAIKVIGKGADSAIAKEESSQFDYTQTNQVIRNAAVQMNAEGDTTLASQLVNSSLENAGSGRLTVTNSANTLTAVQASGGNISLQNLAAAASLDLLEVAAGKSVGVYTGTDESSDKAAVSVTGSAVFGAGAVLNTACLTLADGATLEMSGLENGAVTLNGALTFGSGLEMGDSLLASVEALGYGEMLNLFTGVSEVSLPAVAATESGQVQARSVFSNVQNENLYVEYRVIDNVGSLLVVNVPEPASATLGLAALMMLAARRRRKA